MAYETEAGLKKREEERIEAAPLAHAQTAEALHDALLVILPLDMSAQRAVVRALAAFFEVEVVELTGEVEWR